MQIGGGSERASKRRTKNASGGGSGSGSGSSSGSGSGSGSGSEKYEDDEPLLDAPTPIARYGTGKVVLALFVVAQLVLTTFIIFLSAATMGDNMQSVTTTSVGWVIILLFFIGTNLQMHAALVITATPNRGIYWAGIGAIVAGALASAAAAIIMLVVVSSDSYCYEESFCTEYPAWVPVANGATRPPLATGVEQDAFRGTVFVMWSLLINALIAIVFAFVAATVTNAWHTDNEALERRAAAAAPGSTVGFVIAAMLLTGMYIAIVLLILGGRQGGTPTNTFADRESPGGGEFQWWMFVMFTIFCGGLPVALLFIAFDVLDDGVDAARTCTRFIVTVMIIVGAGISLLYAVNVVAVSQTDLCCARLENLAGAPANVTQPNTTEYERSFLCGAYRANDLTIAGRNTYCGYVESYTPATPGLDDAKIRVILHSDFSTASVIVVIFCVLSLFMLVAALAKLHKSSRYMSDGNLDAVAPRIRTNGKTK